MSSDMTLLHVRSRADVQMSAYAASCVRPAKKCIWKAEQEVQKPKVMLSMHVFIDHAREQLVQADCLSDNLQPSGKGNAKTLATSQINIDLKRSHLLSSTLQCRPAFALRCQHVCHSVPKNVLPEDKR
jgi:hypothetical protein